MNNFSIIVVTDNKVVLPDKGFVQPEIFFNPFRSTNLYIKGLFAFLTFGANHSLKKKAKTVCAFRLVIFKIVNVGVMKPF